MANQMRYDKCPICNNPLMIDIDDLQYCCLDCGWEENEEEFQKEAAKGYEAEEEIPDQSPEIWAEDSKKTPRGKAVKVTPKKKK